MKVFTNASDMPLDSGLFTGVKQGMRFSAVAKSRVSLPDAPSVLRQIAGWIDDYNEIHPHSALRMCSPREFIRALTQ